jgi:cytidylate kinase
LTRIGAVNSGTEIQLKSPAISDKESTRSSYYNYYTGKTWGDSASYDLCVNASRLGPEGTKEFIADFIRRRMKR